MPYSLFAPIVIGLILYSSLSVIYITCLGDKELPRGSAAPMLGMVMLFSTHIITTLLFIDAIIAPLGTANVYTAATARILYGLAKEFFPKSFLNKLNGFYSPSYCLWLNAVVGVCFLLPFPTWSQLVDFLSSIVVFSYLAGPVALIVLRQEMPHLPRPFKVFAYKLIGYAGFACCSLLIYWSNMSNLIYLAVLTIALVAVHNLLIEKKSENLFLELKNNFFITGYLLAMLAVKYLRYKNLISFPVDNLLIIAISYFACKIFIKTKVSKQEIEGNLQRVAVEK